MPSPPEPAGEGIWGGAFAGKVACVSGGAAGIGAAVCRRLAAAGASVVVADVDLAAAEALADELSAEGRQGATVVGCDVGDEAAVAALFDRIGSRHGHLDIVHANAGIEWTRDVRHTSLEEWERVLRVNLTGAFLVARAALRVMCPAGAGAILLTSSPHALATVPDAGAYAASKGGVQALVRALALEAAPFGVRVNGIMPGAIDTPMVRREMTAAADPAEQLRRLAASHPLGRLGTSEEVADLALFLVSPLASFVTGAVFSVDGGLMAALPSGPPLAYGS